MRRATVIAALAAALSLPAAPAAADCRPSRVAEVIARAPGATVYRHAGQRWACVRGMRRRVLDFARGRPRTFAFTVQRGRHVELLDAGPRGTRRLDRGAVRVPQALGSRRFGVVQWRRGARLRAVVAGAWGCPARPRRLVHRTAGVVIFERRAPTGDERDYEGAVFGCDRRRGVRWLLASTEQIFDSGQYVEEVHVRGPYVALSGVAYSSRAGEQAAWLEVHDLRSGAPTAIGGTGPFEGRILDVVISPTGAAGFISTEADWLGPERGFETVPRVWVARGTQQHQLDEGAGIGLRSLRLAGEWLSWRHGDERRTARLF